jgi:hypothetical protein
MGLPVPPQMTGESLVLKGAAATSRAGKDRVTHG